MEMMLSTGKTSERFKNISIGKGGQTFNVFLTGFLGVQQRLKSRRSGDPNTTYRQLRHTWTSLIHGDEKNHSLSVL
jgi:hypothetical protein